jgi:hypothetical protein
MTAIARSLFLVAALCAGVAAHAREPGPHADAHGHGPAPGAGAHARFAGDPRRFGPDERALWRGGGWRHDYRDGRWGWWWVVDGLWYWYDAPVYPYPGLVSVVTYAPPLPPPPATPVLEAPAPVAPVAAPPRFRYFCPDHGYYPDIQTCPTDFVRQPIP